MTQQQVFEGFDIPVDSKAKLLDKFIVPPFSVLDTRQGYWQERKRLWLSLGIQSEIGRGQNARAFAQDIMRGEHIVGSSRKEADKRSNVTGAAKKPGWATGTGTENMAPGTSIFDPVLCELVYKWFCPENGVIFDPFAGGSVRGIVACMLGYDYYGVDLSGEQIKANVVQAREILSGKQPHWFLGDSCDMGEILPSLQYDLVFSCPPYHNLEQYTDELEDLSNVSWDTFRRKYNDIIAKSILRLKPNRFACFVVGEIRDEVGGYKGLVPYTINCFSNNGARFYNELILVNVVGSLPIRIDKQFRSGRKVGKTHQNVLVFYKGDISLISKYHKEIDSGFPVTVLEG